MQSFPGGYNVLLHAAQGTQVPIGAGVAGATGNDQFTEPDWLGAQLTSAGGSYTLTDDASQGKQIFDTTTGSLTAVQDNNGRRVEFAYDGSRHLTTIKDQAGRMLQATYTAGKLTSIAQLQNPKLAAGPSNPVFRQWQWGSRGRRSPRRDVCLIRRNARRDRRPGARAPRPRLAEPFAGLHAS